MSTNKKRKPRYNRVLALELFRECKKTQFQKTRLVHDFVFQCLLFIKSLSSSRIGKYILHERDLIELNALEEVFLLAKKEKLPDTHPNIFSVYVFHVVNRSFLNSIRELKVEDFSSEVPDDFLVSRKPYRTHKDIESSIYVRQLRELVLNLVELDNRFTGPEKDASIFIAKRLLKIRKGNPRVCKTIYGLNDNTVDFLIDYTKHLIKVSTSYLKKVDG